MLEAEKDLVAKMLRAVLQSNRDGVVLDRVQREYHALTGEWIPYKQLGYPTLEGYLRSVPSVVRLERISGEITCFAMVCKETEQIAKLVARQRSSKKRIGGQVNCQMRLKYTSPVTLVGKPKATLRQPDFSNPSEMCTQRPVPIMSTNKGAFQWIERPYSHPANTTSFAPGIGSFKEGLMPKHDPAANRPERRQTIPPRFQKELNTQLSRNQSDNQNANNACQEQKIPAKPSDLAVIQNHLKELLKKYSNGIWLSKLPQIFRDAFKQDLSEEIISQLEKWPHVCTFEKVCSGGPTDVLLYPAGRLKTVEESRPKIDSNHNQESIPVLDLSSKPEPLNKKSVPEHSSPSKPEPMNDQSFQTSNESRSGNLKQKIIGLLQKYSSGLWVDALPKVFEDTYKAKLPEAVLENLDLLSDICTVDYISVNPLKAIIYARSETNQDVCTTKEHAKSAVDQERFHLSEKVSEENKEILPPALVIPNEPSPSVLVVELNSTNEVVIRYVGKDYSAAQECVEDEMKDYYTKNIGAAPIQSLSVGQLVAVSAEENAWLRAQVLSLEGEKIKVFYVDYGFSEMIEGNKARKLGRQFYALPFQATKCRMAGLEPFFSDPVLVKSVESKACGKILAVEILQRSDIPLVVLYDTSGDDDININAMCLKDLYDQSFDVQVKVDTLYTNVRVTNVCSDGTLFCQVPSMGLAKLCDILQKIENYFQSKITSEFFISLPFIGKTCLYYCKGKWARVTITSVHSSRALDVQLMDAGTITTVKVSELREIPPQFLRDIMTIPPQALKCCLADLPATISMWTPDAVLWLRDTVLNCSDCSIKVAKIDNSDGMAHVYLFTPKNILHADRSVNHQITNANLWKHQKDVFLSVNQTGASLIKDKGDAAHAPGLANMGPKKEISDFKKPVLENSFVLCASDLPPLLPLPKPGEHMDVFVSVACHPGHFAFQPWQELHKLEVLMEDMILHYSTAEECPIPVEKNRLYAAKVENKWYRTLLKGILTNGLVSVYQLDYGRHELVSCRKIQPLIDRFRKLPFQAVTAQLAGVKCEQWSEEASIVFRNHVEKKPLVALVQSVSESTDAWDRKVVAYIVDTTQPDTDLWIHYLMSEYLAESLKA